MSVVPLGADALERDLERALVARGAASPERIGEARTSQLVSGGSLELCLWELGCVSLEQLTEIGADLMRCAPATPAAVRGISARTLALLDAELASRAGVLPLEVTGSRLALATASPWRLDVLDEVAFRTGLAIETRYLCEIALRRALERRYDVPAPPRYRGSPLAADSAAPPAAAGRPAAPEPALGELITESEFLALYAGDIAPERDSAGPGFPEPKLIADDTEELLLSEIADEERPAIAAAVHDRAGAGDLAPIASAAEALRALGSARDRRGVGNVLVGFGLSVALRVALFTCRSEVWIGWTGGGTGLAPSRVADLMVPIVGGTAFDLVHRMGSPFLGPLGPHPVHRAFCTAVGTPPGSCVGMFPVRHRGRALFVLYLDGGASGVTNVGEVLLLAQRVPATLESIAVRAPCGTARPG